MFTGIIQSLGQQIAFTPRSGGGRLEVQAPAAFLKPLRLGDSVAVNGCCLTLAAKRGRRFSADLAPETLHRTALGRLRPGAVVNLEAPLRAGDLLGGHLLQGHVEATGEFLELRAGRWLSVLVASSLQPYIVWKGSLAVDGISLTVASIQGDVLGFAIIPFTAAHTNLKTLRAGDRVNLETDPLARHLERLLQARAAAATGPDLPAGPDLKEWRRQGF